MATQFKNKKENVKNKEKFSTTFFYTQLLLIRHLKILCAKKFPIERVKIRCSIMIHPRASTNVLRSWLVIPWKEKFWGREKF